MRKREPEQSIAPTQALSPARQQLTEFKQDCAAFEHKPRMTFAAFEQHMQAQVEENFAAENDYLAWKVAEEGAAYCREKVETLKFGI